MRKVAKFYKVSFEQFLKDWKDYNKDASEEGIKKIYQNLCLPRRATAGSAGYDFYAPTSITLAPGESKKIPTGIRVEMKEGFVLQLFPRSGLGFKFRMQLDNTVGIIDSDYFYSSNEGHILIKLTNDSKEEKSLVVQAGTGFVQGIFLAYGITEDDIADAVRDGGFGSTDGN